MYSASLLRIPLKLGEILQILYTCIGLSDGHIVHFIVLFSSWLGFTLCFLGEKRKTSGKFGKNLTDRLLISADYWDYMKAIIYRPNIDCCP